MELALALGKTVHELKEGMSYEEAMMWGLYRKRHGPFDLQSRMEYQMALLAALQTREKNLKKFVPWYVEPEIEMTPEMMFNQISMAAKQNGKSVPRNTDA